MFTPAKAGVHWRNEDWIPAFAGMSGGMPDVIQPALFDRYVIVDWSAANTPRQGKDSIWIGEVHRDKDRLQIKAPVNPSTRQRAMEQLSSLVKNELSAGRRVFAGFDFPFGYPAGAVTKITGAAGWESLWRTLQRDIEDDEQNRSNRYDLANRWNRDKFDAPHYWGHPHQHRYDHLTAKKPASRAFQALETRIVERWRPPAKSVWQLAYNGAVGSQAMLGMARLQHLRDTFRDDCAIWPFETTWADRLDAPLTIAEVYPSMIDPVFKNGDVKDAAQVRTVAATYAALDEQGAFNALLSRPPDLSDDDNDHVLSEEGWIVGAGHEGGAS